LAVFCQKYGTALPYRLAARILRVSEDELEEKISGSLQLFEDAQLPELYIVDAEYRNIEFDKELLNDILENADAKDHADNLLALRLLFSCVVETGFAFVRFSSADAKKFLEASTGSAVNLWERAAEILDELQLAKEYKYSSFFEMSKSARKIVNKLSNSLINYSKWSSTEAVHKFCVAPSVTRGAIVGVLMNKFEKALKTTRDIPADSSTAFLEELMDLLQNNKLPVSVKLEVLSDLVMTKLDSGELKTISYASINYALESVAPTNDTLMALKCIAAAQICKLE